MRPASAEPALLIYFSNIIKTPKSQMSKATNPRPTRTLAGARLCSEGVRNIRFKKRKAISQLNTDRVNSKGDHFSARQRSPDGFQTKKWPEQYPAKVSN